jgi:hypothetical protein
MLQYLGQLADGFERGLQRDASNGDVAGLPSDSEHESKQVTHARASDAGTRRALQHLIADSPGFIAPMWTGMPEKQAREH